jgi:hypothetical protein
VSGAPRREITRKTLPAGGGVLALPIIGKESTMLHPRVHHVAVAAIAAAIVALIPPHDAVAEQTPAELTLPLRLTAWAVNMSNIATGRNAVVQIRITRWTTAEERTQLLSTVVEDNSDHLMRALLKLPSHGRMNIPGHRGPDPMKVVLGWDLHYAWHQPLDEGGHRIMLATDRYITFEEARANPRTMDYPFTLLEIRLDRNGEGVGKASVATKIRFDKKNNTMELENYGSEPVRLQQVKIER